MAFWPTPLGECLISAYRRGGGGRIGGAGPSVLSRVQSAPLPGPDARARPAHARTARPTPHALTFLIPTPKRRMGLDNLWKPDLRGRIEQGIARVAAGQIPKDQARAGTGD